MFEITAKEVKKELRKIAFWVKNSGFFDEFPARTRNTLEGITGVEWTDVQTDGQTELRSGETWKIAEIEGKFNDEPIKLILERVIHGDEIKKGKES